MFSTSINWSSTPNSISTTPFVATPLVQPQNESESVSASLNSSGPLPVDKLFDKLLEELKKVDSKIDNISGRLKKLEDRTATMQTSLKESSDSSKKHFKSTFTIKGSSYEVLVFLWACKYSLNGTSL